MSEGKSMNQLFCRFEAEGAKLAKHARGSIRALRLAKLCAYRMAKDYLLMQKQDHNVLYELATAKHGTGPRAIDAWLEEWYAPLRTVGDDPMELISAVENGMSLKEYLSHSPKMFLPVRSKASKKDSPDATVPPLPCEPSAELPVEDQVNQWQARAEAAERQVRELRAALAASRARVRSLEKVISRMNRAAETVLV